MMERLTSKSAKGLYALIKRIYSRRYESVWTCTLGKNQTGKTDWNLRQFEMLHELGLADGFGSNMPLKADFQIDFIEDFRTLKQTCKMLNPNPAKHGLKRYFFLVSELADFVPRDTPYTNTEFIKELQKVRKYGLCLLADAIDRVDKRVLNEKHFHGVFHKVSKANPSIAIYEDWTRAGPDIPLFNIPRTTIEFDTYYSASFYMEPQNPEEAEIKLNPDHQIIKKYLKYKSWKKAGIHPQEGKRAVLNVLAYHMQHCLTPAQEEGSQETDPATE